MYVIDPHKLCQPTTDRYKISLETLIQIHQGKVSSAAVNTRTELSSYKNLLANTFADNPTKAIREMLAQSDT